MVAPTLSFSAAAACLAASSARISSRCLKLEMSRSAMCSALVGSCSVMICGGGGGGGIHDVEREGGGRWIKSGGEGSTCAHTHVRPCG